MGGARSEDARVDEFFARPDSGQGIHAVGQRLSEDDDIGLNLEMLHRPLPAGAEKAHLNLIVNDQDAMLAAYFLQALEIAAGGNYVASGALHRLDEKRPELGTARLPIPDAGAFL